MHRGMPEIHTISVYLLARLYGRSSHGVPLSEPEHVSAEGGESESV